MIKDRKLKGEKKSLHRYPEKIKTPEPPEGETVVCLQEHSPDRPILKYVARTKYFDKKCVALGRNGCKETNAKCSGNKEGGGHA